MVNSGFCQLTSTAVKKWKKKACSGLTITIFGYLTVFKGCLIRLAITIFSFLTVLGVI